MQRSTMIAATTTLMLGSLALPQEPKARDEPKAPGVAKAKANVRYELDPSFVLVPGEMGHLFSVNLPSVYVASDFGPYMDLVQSIKANDAAGIKDLAAAGEVVAVPSGTPILVIKANPGLADKGQPFPVEIRILDGKYKDKKAWVPNTFLARVVEIPVRMTPTQQAKAKAKAKAERAKAKAQEAEAKPDPEPKKPAEPPKPPE